MADTITSLAVLKVLADKDQRDFLENFVPFITSLLARRSNSYRSGFDAPQISSDFADEFGLYIPYHPMRTLLERARKRNGCIRREHGRYFIDPNGLSQDHLAKASAEQQAAFRNIEQSFSQFAANKYGKEYAPEEASNVVLAFLKRSDIDLLIAAKNRSVLPNVKSNRRDDFIFYDFVTDIYVNQKALYEFLVGLAFGHILATALVNADINDYTGKLRDLNIYLDTRLVLLALGLDSEEYRGVYIDFLDILRKQGASLFIFDHTRDEIESILEGCRPHLHRDNVDPNRVSRVCLTLRNRGFRDSDLDWQVSQLENELKRLQITIAVAPNPSAFQAHQVDEVKLRDLIVKAFKKSTPQFDEFARGNTIDKDVRSISSIYRLRRGRAPKRLSETKYMFISTNTSLARATRWFERTQYARRRKIPACLTDTFVGTLAWLNLPSQVMRLNYKRLIADCYAAIEPNAELLSRIAEEAETLKQRGQIQQDDYLLVRNDKIARGLLAQKSFGDPDLLNGQVIAEVISIIKQNLTDKAWAHATEQEKRRIAAETRYNELQRKMLERNQRISSTLEKFSSHIATAVAVLFVCGVIIGPLVHVIGKPRIFSVPAIASDVISLILVVLGVLGLADFKMVRRRVAKSIFSFLYKRAQRALE